MPAQRELSRPMLALAGLCGATGVGFAAAGSHGGAPDLAIAANFLLFHAPALIGIALLPRNRLAQSAGYVIVAGLVLFAGDLVTLGTRGVSPFPLAAPIGGSLLILGWLVLALSAFVSGRPGRHDDEVG